MSQPRIAEAEEVGFEISLEDSIKHKLPGYTVDVLLQRGDIAGARAELERLLLEGMDSSNSVEATPQFFENMRERLRRRHDARTSKKTA